MLSELQHKLNGTLVVSCQAEAGTPLDSPEHIAAIAAAVVDGGASAVRIEGLRNIEAVRARVDVPVIGLIKLHRDDTDVYITPSVEDVDRIARAGAHIVAFDATSRPRPAVVSALVEAAKAPGCTARADISTIEEARSAIAAGADMVSTTMAGYTSYTAAETGPDFALMSALRQADIPFAAEGRIWTPEEALHCLGLGARFVVVGSAITRPTLITQRFINHLSDVVAAPAFRRAHS